MPVLQTALHEAWSRLPPDVRENRLVTNRLDGLPTKTTREGILGELVSVIARCVLVGTVSTRIEDHDADALVDEIAVHGETLASYAGWLRELDAVRDRKLIRIDQIARIARQLAVDGPARTALTDADRLQVASESLAAALDRPAALDEGALKALLEDPAARRALEDRLDAVWQARVGAAVSVDRTMALRACEAFLVGSDFAQAEWGSALPVATELSAEAWARILRDGRAWVGTDAQAVTMGLTGVGAVSRPALTGRLTRAVTADDRTPVHPLDANIHARLFRVVKDRTTLFPPTVTARAAFEHAVDASAGGLGVAYEWARAVLGIGAYAGALLLWSGDRRADRELLSRLHGGERAIAAGWTAAVDDVIRRHGQAALRPDAVTFYQSADVYYLGRLWTRVLRRCLVSADPPDASEVWQHVYGAFTSLRGHLKTVAAGGEASVGLERHGVPRHPTHAGEVTHRSAVEDILHTAIDVDGEAMVTRFWDEVATLPRREPVSAARAEQWARLADQWQRWVQVEADAHPRSDLPAGWLDVPFGVARAWLSARGTLAAQSGDVSRDIGVGDHQQEGARA